MISTQMHDTMPRKAAEFWWNLKRSEENKFKAEPNVCRYERKSPVEKWIPVTWKEIFAERTKKQNLNLKLKLRSEHERACFIWVFYNDTTFFSGWFIYIKTLKKDYPLNFRTGRNEDGIVDKIMKMFPCNILPFDFETWAQAFEKKYHHKGFKRTKQGLLKCYCLIDEYGNLKDVYPESLMGNSPILKVNL